MLYELSLERVVQNLPIPEDQRIADWTYLIPLPLRASALVIGCGWGEVPITLAKRCDKVTVVDSNVEKLHLLTARQQQQSIQNLELSQMDHKESLPFADSCFDFVCIDSESSESNNPLSFTAMAQEIRRLLKPNGSAFFKVANRWSALSLFSRTKKRSRLTRHSLPAYRATLIRSGFNHIQAYAPLPYYDGIPLINLPLDDPQAIRFFFSRLFPLFEMVSPESKKSYALEYAAAKIGMRFLTTLRFESLAKYFFTGFGLIAARF